MGARVPPVEAAVAAGAVELLPARLRKRLEGVVDKARGWAVSEGDEGSVRIAVDDETAVVLRPGPGGTVTDGEAVTCSCLLAPACLHRAAVLSIAPLAETTPAPEAVEGEARTEGEAEAGSAEGGASAGDQVPAAQRGAAAALWDAGVAALCAGAAAASLARAALLHAAHAARLAGLHRPAASAVRVARRLAEAREGDSAFRLGELTQDLAALLDEARTVREAEDAAAAREAVGTARRTYEQAGSLRLYGLFTEPVVTASGYAGATAYAVTGEGAIRTVSVVQPGGPERVAPSAGARVPGGAALNLRQLGRGAGLIMTGTTLTGDGRVGGGASVRSVAATGAGWEQAPLDGLWARPVAAQVRAALAWQAEPVDGRPAGGDLLFLTGTVTSLGGLPALAVHPGPGSAAEDAPGPVVVLHTPDERPELPYTANLRALAGRRGAAIRLIARLVPDRPAGVAALALCPAGGEPVDLGLDRLIPGRLGGGPDGPHEVAGRPLALPPVEWDLLSRTVARTALGGRAVAAAAADPALPRRLRTAGLPTAGACADALTTATRARHADALGTMLPADPDAFALAWLTAALYVSATAREFTAEAWAATG